MSAVAARATVSRRSVPAAPAREPARAANAPAVSTVGFATLRLDAAREGGPAGASPVLDLVRSPGPGAPLPGSARAPLETSLRTDLSPVRVHDDSRTNAAVSSAGARALTWGPHVFLGPSERATDLRVMAHEVAHVIQQQGGSALQRFTPGGAGDAFEAEAERVSAAVGRGESAMVTGRTGGARVQPLFGWIKRGLSAIADLGSAVKEKVLGYIRDHARDIPGYDLLAFIIGRDPITQEPVERNAINLIKGLVGLIPGGHALFENLERAKVLQRAGEWFGREADALGFSWGMIRGLFQQAWDALGVSDFLNPSNAWEKIKRIFGPPLVKLKNFALAAGKKILEFIFEGALALGGGSAQSVLAWFRKVADTFSIIVGDPVGFLRNLLNAAKGGFKKFSDRIGEHLKTALLDWLFGALGGTIQFPKKLDFQGVVSIVLQVLGLTYARMRAKLVKLIGEGPVAFLEKSFEFLRVLVTQGIAAAWQKLLEFATGMVDEVIAGIRNFVIQKIVQAAVTKLATMFNPVGAIIQSVIAIYNTVMFFIERAKQLGEFVKAIVDSISNIARGNIGAAIDYVERTLARALSLIVSFLARLIGLGGIADKVKAIIKGVQATVDKAVDRILEWIIKGAKGLLERFAGGGAAGGAPGAAAGSDARARLDRGLEAGAAAVNRFAGKRVGAVVLRPLLGAIRLRYRMARLDVVKAGDTWSVEGKVNPDDGRKTQAKVATADGTPANPFPITWFKRAAKDYPSIWLAPAAKVSGRTPRSKLSAIAGAQEFFPTRRKAVPGGTEEIGVTSKYQMKKGSVVGPSASGRSDSEKSRFNRLLEAHGYDRSETPTDGDHVQELQVSGPDHFDNLWPLGSSENRSSGASLGQQMIDLPSGKQQRLKETSGKYFVIEKFDY